MKTYVYLLLVKPPCNYDVFDFNVVWTCRKKGRKLNRKNHNGETQIVKILIVNLKSSKNKKL